MQKNNSKHWVELDYRIASDYTVGGPEYWRTRLRKQLNLPVYLPGEKSDISQQQHIQRDTFKAPE